MSNPKVVLFSEQLPSCPCYERMFDTQFETFVAKVEGGFVRVVQTKRADVAVVCCCSSKKERVAQMLRLDALSGPVPVVICTRTLSPEFIKTAAKKGVDRFICCTMDAGTIQTLLYEAIRDGGLKEYLESFRPDSLATSPYVRKLIDEILYVFPRRLTEQELGHRLDISRSSLQKHCRRVFGRSFIRLLRHIWVHQALRLMQHTNLDNTEISMHLNYSEETNMARDFRKELGYSPGEARLRLITHSPEELLKTASP
ncbi:MAG: helix-turn-helix transcriptional regulator [Desulfobacterales bacterium]